MKDRLAFAAFCGAAFAFSAAVVVVAWPMVRIARALSSDPGVPIGKVLFGDAYRRPRGSSL